MGSVLTRETLHEEAKVVEEIDRISDLPDSILCHILSYLPTKYAVATTILSTKWKYLFTSLFDLDFDDSLLLYPKEGDGNPMDRVSFMNFVDRLLNLRDLSLINKFRLKCHDCDTEHMSAWIQAAVLQKVQEFELCLTVKSDTVLHGTALFTCGTLVGLKLSGNFMVKGPEKVCLPSLKKIHLDGILFYSDESLRMLISSCPVLQDLAILGCGWDFIMTCYISAPALKSLTIDCLLKNENNTKYLEYNIVIDAPNLLYLKYIGNVPKGFSVKNLESLVEVHLDVRTMYMQYNQVVDDILVGISQVQFLHLSADSMEAFGGSFFRYLPKFYKLTSLELGLNSCMRCKHLPSLLKCAPFLGSLVFLEGRLDRECEHHDNTKWCCIDAPLSFLLHLVAIEIRYYRGSIRELNMIKYFLNNARVLKKITVHSIGMAQRRLLKERKKISKFPRGSSTCQVEIF